MNEQPADFGTTFNSYPSSFKDGEPSLRFGTDVLSSLVAGMSSYRNKTLRRSSRSMGPAALGCAMWLDDDELIEEIKQYSAAAFVVSKQKTPKNSYQQKRIDKLDQLAADGPGLSSRFLREFEELAPKDDDGEPVTVGPYSPETSFRIPTVRTLGYRKIDNHMVPIIHAKLVLLGEIWWHDEGPNGEVMDVYGFRPERLWISSANLTTNSRKSLEVGSWTTNGRKLEEARAFLTKLIIHSEKVNPESDAWDPDYAEVEYDDLAMAEAMSELDWEDPDDEI